MESLVAFIREENFEREVMGEKEPVLLLCMPRGEEFPKSVESGRRYRPGVYPGTEDRYFGEGLVEPFKKIYGVIGTPTFLLLVEGKERARILGLADREMLTGLISKSYR